jgi:hypothetical protein
VAEIRKTQHNWADDWESRKYLIRGVDSVPFLDLVKGAFAKFNPHELRVEFFTAESHEGSPWITRRPIEDFLFTMAAPPELMKGMAAGLKGVLVDIYGVSGFDE